MKRRSAFGLVLCGIVMMLLSVPTMAFSDVPSDAWYAEEVRFVADNGLMGGTGANRFEPDGTVSRGMLVTIIFRMDGASAGSPKASFLDVQEGSYYEDAVAWAVANGIVSGYSSTKFGPNDSVTREQFATILYRYASYKGTVSLSNGNLRKYTDSTDISTYAIPAMIWANENGLITGTSATTLSPKGTTTRAQTAAIMMRYLQARADQPDDDPTTSNKDDEHPKETETNDNTATTQPEIKVCSVTANKGEQVTIDVNVMNNPGILGMTLSISYDNSALTLIGIENGDALKDVLTFIPAKNLKSGSTFVWYGTEVNSSQIKDGCVLRLSFEIAPNANGVYPIVVTASKNDIVGTDLNPVNIMITNGTITTK